MHVYHKISGRCLSIGLLVKLVVFFSGLEVNIPGVICIDCWDYQSTKVAVSRRTGEKTAC